MLYIALIYSNTILIISKKCRQIIIIIIIINCAINDEKPSLNATVIVVPQLFYNVQPKNNNHTNYHVWSKKMCSYIESTYHEHGSFIKDNEYYSPA